MDGNGELGGNMTRKSEFGGRMLEVGCWMLEGAEEIREV
jgi:hypothetical protein